MGSGIYEIDLSKKYIIKVGENVPIEDIETITKQLREWINRPNEPFILLWGDIELVKTDAGKMGDAAHE